MTTARDANETRAKGRQMEVEGEMRWLKGLRCFVWHMDNPVTIVRWKRQGSYDMSFKLSTGVAFDAFCMTVSCEMVWSSAFVAGL
jgi:hypothetical protein